MALDGCQPLERFMKKEFEGHGAGSAQKSWAFCPSSRMDGRGQQGAPTPPVSGGYVGYSVSGYVNGYNPTLPAYPPTRAQMQAAARNGGEPAPPPGQNWAAQRKPTAVWDGPAPRGDPNKPGPGSPYYVSTPPEEVFDAAQEIHEVPIGGGGRLPMLGCDASAAKIALENGIKHIRCGSCDDPALTEAGKAIAAQGPRENVFVSAKLRPNEHANVKGALTAILSALGTDYLDLFSIEWPVLHKTGTTDVDSEGSLEATWTALEKCVADGKVKALGVANFSVPAIERLMKHCTIKPTVNEVELHPLLAQRKLVGVCRRYGLTTVAHTSLANGDERLLKHAKLIEAASLEGGSQPVEALLTRWSMQRGVPCIIDSTSALGVQDCLKARTFRLTNKQKLLLDDIEPSPKLGGVRFHHPSFEFNFDDPFLGGCARPGLDLVPN